MGLESHYNGSGKINQSAAENDWAIRRGFQQTLHDAFITREEEFAQFK